jgi:histidinol-phosphate aminotransferase
MIRPFPKPAKPLRKQRASNPFPGVAALERRSGVTITARLSANEALPLYSESLARRYGQGLLEQARLYPDPSAYALRRAIASEHGLSLDEVLVDAGADALIFMFLRAFADLGSIVVLSTGTYPTVDYFARSLGLRTCPVNYACRPTPAADLGAIAEAAWHRQARVVYLANPDNPTGSAHSGAALQDFARTLPEYTLLILDEAYEAFGRAAGDWLLPNVVRLRSFSKALGLAGLRVGYAMAPAPVLELAQAARLHYAVGTLAQDIATQAWEDRAHRQLLIAATDALRIRFYEMATATGLGHYSSATNFVTLPLASERAGERLRQRLLERGASLYLGQLNGHLPIARVTLQPELFTAPLSEILFTPEEARHGE